MPKAQKRSLKQDVMLNKHDLPGEWEKQPELYRYWAEEYAFACLERDQAKEQLELVQADLDLDIRKDPKKYGIEKVTESTVASKVKQQEEYGDAIEKYNQAKFVVIRMNGAKEAMEHRRDALKGLEGLALGNFYSANTAPPESVVKKGRELRGKFAEQVKKQRRQIVS